MLALDLGLFLVRVVVGLTIAAHGYNKIFGGGKLAGTGRWFESMGLRPGWLHARLAAGTEVSCGLAFAAGFLTPLVAAGIVGVMTVAGIVAHRKNGFFVFRPGEGIEYVLVLGTIAAGVATTGPGRWAIDHAIGLDLRSGWGLAISAGGGIAGAALLLALCYRPVAKAAA